MRSRGVTFHHPGSGRGIDPIDLEIAPGEVVAILGPNGSGKTTLLRLLATDLRSQGGELELLGLPAGSRDGELRRRLAFIPDEPFHILPLTGRENLEVFGALRGARSIRPASAVLETAAVLDIFGLARDADRPVVEYSFGMRRKLLLVESFLALPELLIADEPSVGLDPPAMAALREGIAACAARGGAVVLGSNEIREVPFWADRILLLHRGRPVVDGAPAALLSELRGRTRITITFRESDQGGDLGGDPASNLRGDLGIDPPREPDWLKPARSLTGIVRATLEGGTLEAESVSGGGPLPELLRILLQEGLGVRDVRLREPGLEELFRDLTGDSLAPAPGDPSG